MGWNEVDEKMKKIDANFVACTEDHERQKIKQIVKDEFPDLNEAMIEYVINSCCMDLAPPRGRDRFIACMKAKLGR